MQIKAAGRYLSLSAQSTIPGQREEATAITAASQVLSQAPVIPWSQGAL